MHVLIFFCYFSLCQLFSQGTDFLQTFTFLRRVINKAHRFVITCLKLAIKIVGVSRICCFFNRTQ